MKNKILLVGIIIISCLTGLFIGAKLPQDEKNVDDKTEKVDNALQSGNIQDSINITPLTNEEIKKRVEKSDETDEIKVNSITEASDKIIINKDEFKIVNGILTINGKEKKLSEKLTKVTGYYFQPGVSYNIFVLAENNKVYKLTRISKEDLLSKDFVLTELENIDRLLLVGLEIYNDTIGMTPERYRVYAEIDGNIIHAKEY